MIILTLFSGFSLLLGILLITQVKGIPEEGLLQKVSQDAQDARTTSDASIDMEWTYINATVEGVFVPLTRNVVSTIRSLTTEINEEQVEALEAEIAQAKHDMSYLVQYHQKSLTELSSYYTYTILDIQVNLLVNLQRDLDLIKYYLNEVRENRSFVLNNVLLPFAKVEAAVYYLITDLEGPEVVSIERSMNSLHRTLVLDYDSLSKVLSDVEVLGDQVIQSLGMAVSQIP